MSGARTLVVGANGKIGRIVCRRAGERGDDCVAMVRSEDQRAAIETLGVATVVADLEGELEHAFDGVDRVVFTAGSGGHTGGDKTLLIDLYGAIRCIDESERRSLDHFVMVSALRVNEPMTAPPAMRHYMVAKMLADERLERSSVPYTILRPGRLTDEPGTGRVVARVADAKGVDISRENVAEAVIAALSAPPEKGGRVVDLLDGDVPIEQLFG